MGSDSNRHAGDRLAARIGDHDLRGIVTVNCARSEEGNRHCQVTDDRDGCDGRGCDQRAGPAHERKHADDEAQSKNDEVGDLAERRQRARTCLHRWHADNCKGSNNDRGCDDWEPDRKRILHAQRVSASRRIRPVGHSWGFRFLVSCSKAKAKVRSWRWLPKP